VPFPGNGKSERESFGGRERGASGTVYVMMKQGITVIIMETKPGISNSGTQPLSASKQLD
jgi:hypothetical protein